eukprot:363570_1
MSDKRLRSFVSDWKKNLSAIERGECEMDVFCGEILDKNMLFHSPAVHKPITNALYITNILKWIIEIIEGFHYKDIDYYDGNTGRIGMVFAGKIKDTKSNKYFDVEGIDLIKLNENCTKVTELKVMIRPHNSLTLVKNEMMRRIQKLNIPKL